MSVSDISPVRQGQTDPPSTWTFKNRLGKVVPLPAGSTLTLYLYNPKTNIVRTGVGTWDTTLLTQGQATYSWNSVDTAVVGTYKVIAGYVTPSGGAGFTEEEDLEIKPIFNQQ